MKEPVDWADLARQARRSAVAKAPTAPVSVLFRTAKGDERFDWPGQAYGGLAVVEATDGYQLIHVPTGRFIRGHDKPAPLRMLALALNACGVDWIAIDADGLRHRPDDYQRLQPVIFGWDVRYGDSGKGL